LLRERKGILLDIEVDGTIILNIFNEKLGIELNLSASLWYGMAMSGLFRPSSALPSLDKTQKLFV
jgi:hypothetical protein